MGTAVRPRWDSRPQPRHRYRAAPRGSARLGLAQLGPAAGIFHPVRGALWRVPACPASPP